MIENRRGFESDNPLGFTRCDVSDDYSDPRPFVFVIFGGAGDLARRKLLPTLFSMYARGNMPRTFEIIAFGRQELDHERYRRMIEETLETSEETGEASRELIGEFIQRLYFAYGHFEEPGHYKDLKRLVAEKSRDFAIDVIYYLSIPSTLYNQVIEAIHESSLPTDPGGTKIIIEKPFGKNITTALELNNTVNSVFQENQVFRMDHYLGKETVQNIIFFRFANSIFEPLWNRNYIDSIQITVAENLGVEHRGRFYEKTGVIRDIFQNHMLQVLALVTMEPPASFEAQQVRDEKVKVLRSLRPVAYGDVREVSIAGQYVSGEINGTKVKAYRDEENVDPRSSMPTFFAAKVHLDNWRWAGVPIYVRTGKRLPRRVTEVVINFKQPPLKLFKDDCVPLDSTSLVLTVQPDEQIRIRMGVKYPESSNLIVPVEMSFRYNDFFDRTFVGPYERLLRDCLGGDQALFVRQDAVEASWEYSDPFVEWWEECDCLEMYTAGTWGPEGSSSFMSRDGRKWETV